VDTLPDAAARARAVDPTHNVVLEASAGTGKTHVLVDRYLNLLSQGVEPTNILAITFTRKAAAEMRARIVNELRKRADAAGQDQQLWRDMRDRSGDVDISTIDAFCLSLLREFPLEANLDPGFEMADETLVPRLMEEALDQALDIGRGLARTDDYVRLLFAELREQRLRDGLANMIDRRLVVDDAIDRALASGPARSHRRDGVRGRVRAAPRCVHRSDRWRRRISRERTDSPPSVGHLLRRHAVDCKRHRAGARPGAWGARSHREPFSQQGQTATPAVRWLFRERLQNRGRLEDSPARRARVAGEVANVLKGFQARSECGAIACGKARLSNSAPAVPGNPRCSRRTRFLRDARSGGLTARADGRIRAQPIPLEGRYHHVLLDEFQDTSRAQWMLVALLIRSWGEGSGLAENAPLIPSIFLVGDRKQSIYAFRDADVAVMDEAGAFVDQLRADGDSRRAISRSFRAVPQLLALPTTCSVRSKRTSSAAMPSVLATMTGFPVSRPVPPGEALGLVAAASVADHADAVASEIRRLLDAETLVRDPDTQQLPANDPKGRRHPLPDEGQPLRTSRRRSSASTFHRTYTRARFLRG
jgi:ATP-dependent helicase/nuclease subunit A